MPRNNSTPQEPDKFTVKKYCHAVWLKVYSEQIEFTPVHIPQFKSIAIVQNIETVF